MKCSIFILFFIFVIGLFAQNKKYPSYLSYPRWNDSSSVADTPPQDTLPPDKFDTPVAAVFTAPNQVTFSWLPAEIDSPDVATLSFAFDFSEYGVNNPASLNIPWATAAADSDTVIAFQIIYNTSASGEANLRVGETITDTSDVLSFIATITDSSSNSNAMSAETEDFKIYLEDTLLTASTFTVTDDYDSIYYAPDTSSWWAAKNNTWLLKVSTLVTQRYFIKPGTGLGNPHTDRWWTTDDVDAMTGTNISDVWALDSHTINNVLPTNVQGSDTVLSLNTLYVSGTYNSKNVQAKICIVSLDTVVAAAAPAVAGTWNYMLNFLLE